MSQKKNNPDKPLSDNKHHSPEQTSKITISSAIQPRLNVPSSSLIPPEPTFMAIVNRSEYQEVVSFFQSHPEFNHFQSHPDHLCHALKVIALIRPHEKFNTKFGIHIQPLDDSWAWLWRWVYREDRVTNIQTIRIIFLATFMALDKHLETMECFNQKENTRSLPNRVDLVAQIQNTQMVERLIQSIQCAQKGIENLKTTYADDTHTCARIDMLMDSISDKLQLVKISLEYLNGNPSPQYHLNLPLITFKSSEELPFSE